MVVVVCGGVTVSGCGLWRWRFSEMKKEED